MAFLSEDMIREIQEIAALHKLRESERVARVAHSERQHPADACRPSRADAHDVAE